MPITLSTAERQQLDAAVERDFPTMSRRFSKRFFGERLSPKERRSLEPFRKEARMIILLAWMNSWRKNVKDVCANMGRSVDLGVPLEVKKPVNEWERVVIDGILNRHDSVDLWHDLVHVAVHKATYGQWDAPHFLQGPTHIDMRALDADMRAGIANDTAVSAQPELIHDEFYVALWGARSIEDSKTPEVMLWTCANARAMASFHERLNDSLAHNPNMSTSKRDILRELRFATHGARQMTRLSFEDAYRIYGLVNCLYATGAVQSTMDVAPPGIESTLADTIDDHVIPRARSVFFTLPQEHRDLAERIYEGRFGARDQQDKKVLFNVLNEMVEGRLTLPSYGPSPAIPPILRASK